MRLSDIAVQRPVATTLLTLAIALVGALAFTALPVSPLPQIDLPTIAVTATLPGANPETMASSVATPLERSLGRIAGVSELTSTSGFGSSRITLQFDLGRDINGAARDVQSAINAARALLPSDMPSAPTYRKVNPADAPIMVLALTSRGETQAQMYDLASSFVAQKLLQIPGVGDVTLGGSALPAVRVELDPGALSRYGIGLEAVRAALTGANTNRPKGMLESGDRNWQIDDNDQLKTARDYLPLIVAYRNNAPVRLSAIAEVDDSEQDLFNAGQYNGQPSVLLVITRAPGSNIIATTDRIRAALPQLQASLPQTVRMNIAIDRSPSIRAALSDVERSLLLSVGLVVGVVYAFLRRGRATLIPAISIPVSLAGTFGVMYLCHFSLNTLSLMALTVATGFVVDDTIVVLENVTRHIEAGATPRQAALRGAREVGFTVLAMSLSLIAVFLPVLLMGGILGRLFREFAITLGVSILISLAVSLTTTPMLCARWLKPTPAATVPPGQAAPTGLVQAAYGRTLAWALTHERLVLGLLLVTVALNAYLYVVAPKTFFPQQDTGQVNGAITADQSISFQAMSAKINRFQTIVRHDPDVDSVVSYTGSVTQRNTGIMFIKLKPLGVRKDDAEGVMARLRRQLDVVPGAQLILQAVQDIRTSARASNAQYQYTLQGSDLTALREWTPRVEQALRRLPILADVNSDQQDNGLQSALTFNRDRMSALGLTQSVVDATLYDAFGQRQVSTLYQPLNQYHVVMELAPRYWRDPSSLDAIYVPSRNGKPVPLSAFSHYASAHAALAVNHQGQFAAMTISFNLRPGTSLSQATTAIERAVSVLQPPSSLHASFQGTAKTFVDSMSSEPWLILAALIAVYIVTGMLYESAVHPLTILSTLPTAGVGALLALRICRTDFSVIALIGVLLLIGIVKKNAIMMVDFALDATRRQGLSPRDAIFQACVQRFRPIMMTTLAALFGALPLALGHGDGAELRRPLGIAIVGGLIISQLLTLYTTPVVYLYLDRLRARPPRCPATMMQK